MLKQQLAEKQDTIVKLPASATQKVDSPKQTSNVKTKNEGDSFSPTQEVSKVILMQNACSTCRDGHSSGLYDNWLLCIYNMCW